MKNLLFNYSLFISILLSFSVITSCEQKPGKENPYKLDIVSEINDYKIIIEENPDKELVDLEMFIPGISLDIRYATENNFTGEIIYKAAKAYVRKPVAGALKKVQEELKYMGFALKVFDAYRPYTATMKFYKV